jgi:hypothetical protein
LAGEERGRELRQRSLWANGDARSNVVSHLLAEVLQDTLVDEQPRQLLTDARFSESVEPAGKNGQAL